MKPSIKKAISGKTMRVATTFTGAAACAVAFGPPAMAGTVHSAHQPALERLRPRSVVGESCRPGTSHWLHLANNKQSDRCFGFSGTLHVSYYTTSYCGGTNYGWIAGIYDSSKQHEYFTYFGPGTTYAHIPGTSRYKLVLIESEHISRWKGTDKCAFP